MNEKPSFLSLSKSCSEAVAWVEDQLNRAGSQVLRTFDLQAARIAHTGCSCPHHGTDACDCQLVVLLVYGNWDHPVTLVAHGQDGQTSFSVVSTPQQRTDSYVEDLIQATLTAGLLADKSPAI